MHRCKSKFRYKLTCTDVNPNLDINVVYNEYLQGLRVDETLDQWKWVFKPIKPGNTELTIYFTYKGAPIGEPVTKEIRIKVGGAPFPCAPRMEG